MSLPQPYVDQTLRQAATLAHEGELRQAELLYRAVLNRFPGHRQALDGLSALKESLRPPAGGLTKEQAAGVLALYNEGRLADALKLTSILAAQNPAVPFLHNLLGAIHCGLGQLDQAVPSYRRAVALKPDLAEAHNNLADALIAMGQHEEALASLQQALELSPGNPMMHHNKGNALAKLGRHEEALASYREALKLRPELPDTHNRMGNALNALGRSDAAIAAYETAVRLKPDFCEAHNNLGLALYANGDAQQAVAHFVDALKANTDFAPAYNGLALALDALGRPEEAVQNLKRAIALKPGYAQAHSNLCDILERLNRVPELSSALEQAQRHCPADDPRILYRTGQLAMREKDYRQARKVFEKIDPEALPAAMKEGLLTLLGKICDKLNDYDDAYSYFSRANDFVKTMPAAQNCDPEGYIREVEDLTISFAACPDPDDDAAWDGTIREPRAPPVFLVGFPRSGTTLLDTILRSHPAITVVEEQPMVQRMRSVLGADYSYESLEELSEAELAALREAYFEELDSHAADAAERPVLIDKLPLNIVHAGLIHRVFPNARFIFSLRHPCDCVLSCFMQNFRLNDAMANFLDLETSADLYDAVMRLWFTYQDRLPLDVHYVRYEDLITDMEGTLTATLDYLGVPWAEDVLNYRDTALLRGRIGTPSYHQVTEKLYTQSSGRWQHYYARMEPVIPRLEAWARKWGYR